MFSENLGWNFCWNKSTNKSLGTLDENRSRDVVFYVAHYEAGMWLNSKYNAVVKGVLCRQGDQSTVMVLEGWIFHWPCSHRSFCSNNMLCLALRESYWRCCSCRKVIWLVGKYTGHKSPLSSVFLPLCVHGTVRGQKHGKEENLCSVCILQRCIWTNKIMSGFPTSEWGFFREKE